MSVDADAVSPWRRHLADRTPYRATSFRVIYALAAVAATVVLLLLLRATGRSPWWATLLAWNPLVTLEVGGMGHVDVVGVLLVLLGLYAMTRSRPLAAAAMLAMAVAVKPIALLVAPFMIRDAGGRRVAAAAVFAATLALLYAPPMLFQNGYAGWRQQARMYSQSWEANGSFYELITRTFGVGDEGRAMQRAKEMSRLLGAAAVIGVALAAWRFGASPAAAGYWLCLTTLLVSPVAYPWYLMWALCFVPMLDGRAGWTAMVWAATAAVSYVAWHQPTWRLNSSTLLVEYTPVYVTLLVEVAMALRRARFAATRDDAGDVATPLFTARSC